MAGSGYPGFPVRGQSGRSRQEVGSEVRVAEVWGEQGDQQVGGPEHSRSVEGITPIPREGVGWGGQGWSCAHARTGGARGVGGCARGGPRGAWGPEEGWESSVPPRQSPALSLSRARPVVRGLCSAGKRLREKGGLACRASEAAPRKPAWARRAPPTGQRENRWLPLVRDGQCVLRSFVHPGLGFRIQAVKNFEVWNIASVLVSIGSVSSLALQTTMKNQDKKNGAAKQSGNTSNPKSNPGQAEVGPEGTQGRPSQPAPATEAEGSSSQAPGKTEGVCHFCFPAGRGRSLWCARIASGVPGLGHCLPRKEEM